MYLLYFYFFFLCAYNIILFPVLLDQKKPFHIVSLQIKEAIRLQFEINHLGCPFSAGSNGQQHAHWSQCELPHLRHRLVHIRQGCPGIRRWLYQSVGNGHEVCQLPHGWTRPDWWARILMLHKGLKRKGLCRFLLLIFVKCQLKMVAYTPIRHNIITTDKWTK